MVSACASAGESSADSACSPVVVPAVFPVLAASYKPPNSSTAVVSSEALFASQTSDGRRVPFESGRTSKHQHSVRPLSLCRLTRGTDAKASNRMAAVTAKAAVLSVVNAALARGARGDASLRAATLVQYDCRQHI